MSKYDEIENIHSYHGTREKLGVDVSGVEIDHSKVVEYCQVRGDGAKDMGEAEGWEVNSSWREGAETVYGMRREFKKHSSLLFNEDGSLNAETKEFIRKDVNESLDRADATMAAHRLQIAEGTRRANIFADGLGDGTA